MTLEEAKKIAEVCETADGGCGVCVNDLREQLAEAFPQFNWEKAGYAQIEVTEKT